VRRSTPLVMRGGGVAYLARVKPLPMVAWGLALVVVDFRTEAFDLVPDALGWALIAVAAGRLGLTAAAALAVLAGAASLADIARSYRYVRVDALTGERVPDDPRTDLDHPLHLVYDDITGWRLAAVAFAALIAGIALWVLLSGLARTARSGGRGAPAARLEALRWLVVGLSTVPLLAVVGHAVVFSDGAFDPVWNGAHAYLTLAEWAVFAYLIVVVLRESRHIWGVPIGSSQLSPWEVRRYEGGGPTTHG
jgi:hypothetical protein